MRTIVNGSKTLRLGKQGENLAREFVFPVTTLWAQEFGGGAAQLLCRPPGGERVYPAVLEMEDGAAVWHVAAEDVARQGWGCCELRWSLDGRVVKSHTYATFTAPGLSGGEMAPWDSYLEKILEAASQTLEAAARAEAAAVHAPIIQDGSWWVWDQETGAYADTGSGVSGGGADGVLDHRALTFRDAENQHPIASITGLAEAVNRIPAPTQPITNIELEELLHE